MDTDTLIAQLAAAPRPTPRTRLVWLTGLAAAVATTALVFAVVLHVRPDIGAALHSVRFLFKFVVTGSLVVVSLAALPMLASPSLMTTPRLLLLAITPALVFAGVGSELAALPRAAWYGEALGQNALICMTFIPLLAVAPTAIMLYVLRQGATTTPRLTGAVIGLFSGAIAATFYAAHCTNDSPLFVAIWYVIGIGVVTAVSAWLGGRVLRW